jgi:hypothetical protein
MPFAKIELSYHHDEFELLKPQQPCNLRFSFEANNRASVPLHVKLNAD